MNASKNSTVGDSRTPRKQKTSIKGVPDPSMTIRPIPIEQLDLSSKRMAVVGGTNGLGRAIAAQALARGAEVTVVGRKFRDDPADRLTFVAADLSSMKDAVRVGRELPAESFDVVLFTTGIIAAKTREETPEHVERDVAISYLSRLAILQGLSPRLGSAREASAPRPRVFVMGSPGTGEIGNPDDLNSEKDYRSMAAHGNTLAGNEILVLGAKDRFPGPAFFDWAPTWSRPASAATSWATAASLTNWSRPPSASSCNPLRPTPSGWCHCFSPRNSKAGPGSCSATKPNRSCRLEASTAPTSIATCRPPKPSSTRTQLIAGRFRRRIDSSISLRRRPARLGAPGLRFVGAIPHQYPRTTPRSRQ